MQFAVAAFTVVLTFAAAATATPLEARAKGLKDWQVTYVSSFTPSGRPGSYPWASIFANVTDPNLINLGTAPDGTKVTVPAGSQGINCVAKYFTVNNGSPVGHIWPCDPIEGGYWTMQVLAGSEGSFSSTNFNLKFTHVADVQYLGSQYTASFEGEGHFELGKQLAGVCGGSGVCSWSLKADQKPVLVKPKKL